MARRVRILDTTLRDGEQTPGLSLTPEKKLLIARKLDELGVDVIEAGSAVASAGERYAIKLIATEGLNAQIASFCRGLTGDIDAALECDVDAVSIVIPTSDLHITKKLRSTREKVLEMSNAAVEYAKRHGLVVEILAEDGSRTEIDYLRRVFGEGIARGADRVCVCDTVGVLNPERTREVFGALAGLQAPLAFHGHNDLGLAVANSLAAVSAGAAELHACMNGLGERAGNAALEEIAVGLKFFYGIDSVKLSKLSEVSAFVEGITGLRLAPNKPLVGKNAFTHESGIHVDGVIKSAETYEPITPELIGQRRRIWLGKHSGRHSVRHKLKELGVSTSEEQFEEIFRRVKELGDKGKEVTDADFQAIVFDVLGTAREGRVKLEELTATTGNKITPTASVKLRLNGEFKSAAGTGNGPVDAAINAIENALGGTGVKLESYHVDAITGGTDALVDVKIRLRKGDREVSASAAATDIVLASVEALIKGLNLLL
ncbi:MAG: 2-isopropylmalate synthase [Candidatus Micrarchaeia archaeon]